MFQDTSFSQPAPAPKRGKITTFVHFFIKQLKLIEADQDSNYTFFGRPLDLICIVGVIKNMEKKSTIVHYHIEDSSGAIECMEYLAAGNERNENMNLKIGSMIKVYGKLKTANGAKTFTAVTIRSVDAYSEVLYHRLASIRDACQLEHLSKGMSLAVAMGNPGRELAASLAGQHDMDFNSTTSNNGNMGGYNFDSALKNKLMMMIGACIEQFGITKQELQEALPQTNEKELTDTLQFLSDEGHIYTTVTDNHFQMTGR